MSMDLELASEHRAQVEDFRRKHRAGLPALLSADIVGYTRLKHAPDVLSAPRPRGRRLKPLPVVATLIGPTGSLFVARFRLPDFTRERIPRSAGEESGGRSRTAEPFVPWPIRWPSVDGVSLLRLRLWINFTGFRMDRRRASGKATAA